MKKTILLFIAATVIALTSSHFNSSSRTVAAPMIAAEQTAPLYRYQTKTGLDAYAALPQDIEAFDKLAGQNDDLRNGLIFYRRQRVVGHVFLTKAPGTVILYALFKNSNEGVTYFYTTDINEAVVLQKNGWEPKPTNKGIACYVATKPLPGTMPVYRLQQPDGVDVLYAFGNTERKMVSHLKEERIAFYVWAQPSDGDLAAGGPSQSAKPDLSVGDIKDVQAKSVTFVVNNYGGGKVPAGTITAQLAAKKSDGNFAWFEQQTIAQDILPGAGTKVTVKTNNDMRGLKVQILVDALNKVEESNEQNNQSGYFDGPLFIIAGKLNVPVVTPTLPPPAVVDLTLRKALYINGALAYKVNTRSRYVTAGGSITVKKREAINCDGDICTYNLAFLAQRNGGEGSVSTYAMIGGSDVGLIGNTVSFEPGATSADVVLACKLKVGPNKLTVSVDPYKKTAETDEGNNSFEVTIIVEP